MDGSRISGKGVHMYKVRVDLLIVSHFTDTKLFHFHRIFKNWGRRRAASSEPTLDPPLL